jgi:hypothetical protein
MAKFALFDDALMDTADSGVKTRHEAPGAKSGQSTGAPWLIDYLNATTPPDDRVICYRQLVGGKWVWGATVHPKATVVNPYSRRALRTREALGREVPDDIEIVQAPANEGSVAA